MGLFSIFKKNKTEQASTIHKDITINENGEIHGTIHLETAINGKKFWKDIPINTTVEKITRLHDTHEQNRNNPASCERTPNADEMLLPVTSIDKYTCIINHDIVKKLFDKRRSASLNGYNNIVISKSDYGELEKAYIEEQDFKELTQKVYSLLNQAQAYEKNGDFDNAISIYQDVIRLNFYCSGYAENKPFDRLMILYRKKKEPENERAIIKEAIRFLTERNHEQAIDAITKNPHLEKQIALGESNCERVTGDNGIFCYIPYDIHQYEERLSKLK